jgi:hypothetical protein
MVKCRQKKEVEMKNEIKLFESQKVRTAWDEENEKWWFSVIDIVAVLVDQSDYQKARKYWNKLKQRLTEEGNESVTNCHQLKMMAADGKYYKTDVADTEQILRLVQSVPSKKAEPFKMWLARVGNDRIEEIQDPEKALNRSRGYWQKLGRSDKWIQQRMMGQETRNKLTDYWQDAGVEEPEQYAILTNIIHSEWAGLSVKEHKELKGLKRQNLRDHMNESELIFTALAELSTRQIAENDVAVGFEQNKVPARKGGKIARDAREALELKTGKSVVTGENFLPGSQQNSKRLQE